MFVSDLAGTATVPYPDIFMRDRELWQWEQMEGMLLSFIDEAAVRGPAAVGFDDRWQWVLLPWDADQMRYDDTKGMDGFDGSVPILASWLEDAGALERLPANTMRALLADSTVYGRIGYDDRPLEEQFYRVIPERMLTVYPKLPTVSDHWSGAA